MIKFDELKDKSAEEFKKMLEELKAEMRALRFKAASGDSKTAHRFKEIKKTVARISTIMSLKK